MAKKIAGRMSMNSAMPNRDAKAAIKRAVPSAGSGRGMAKQHGERQSTFQTSLQGGSLAAHKTEKRGGLSGGIRNREPGARHGFNLSQGGEKTNLTNARTNMGRQRL